MRTTSTSRRNIKALPVQDATILVEHCDAKIIKCKARQGFTVNNSHVDEGETFFLVASERRAHRYYVVHYNNLRNTYQCSCGCNMCEHEHLKTVREYVMANVVLPAKPDATPMAVPAKRTAKPQHTEKAESTPVNYAEIAKERPLTTEEWKAIQKADKARQKAWRQEYWAKVKAARAEQQQEAV